MKALDPTDAEIEELLEGARQGNPAARDKLVAWARNYLRAQADHRIREGNQGHVLASDIAQEAAIDVYRALEDFEGSTAKRFRGWLNEIARNRFLHTLRDSHRQKRDQRQEDTLEEKHDEVANDHKSASQLIAQREEAANLYVLISELAEDQRRFIVLHFLHELSIADVATRMNRSSDAVHSLRQRALASLMKKFAPEADASLPADVLRNREKLATVLDDVMRARDAGKKIDMVALVEAYPEIADDVRQYVELINKLRTDRFSDPDDEE